MVNSWRIIFDDNVKNWVWYKTTEPNLMRFMDLMTPIFPLMKFKNEKR